MQRSEGRIDNLFRNGPMPRDGQSLGISETEKFRRRLKAADSPRPARFVLELEAASAY